MKTRYSSLVSVKKNIMQKSERAVQAANLTLQNAKTALQASYKELELIDTPDHGKIKDFLSTRVLLSAQIEIIKHNEAWVVSMEQELRVIKEHLKKAMIEFEKFQYLEFQEIEKELIKQKRQEAKNLDEVALITYAKKDIARVA